MPNKERIKLLVDALRSGEYQQTNSQLTYRAADDTERHCCLGVACKVAMQHGVALIVEERFTYVVYDNEGGLLPEKVQRWYGFDRTNPLLEVNGGTEAATVLNDSGSSFNIIADAFERTYLTETEESENNEV